MLRDTYYDAVYAAGGQPLLLPPVGDEDDVRRLLARFGAVVIGGGDDFHPSLWSDEEVHPACTLVTARRQRFDLLVARIVLATKIPFLGICCGMQALNVAAGGAVTQDLGPGTAAHKAGPGAAAIRHELEVAADSLLARLGGERFASNSYHHQAVGRIGAGLAITAIAPDGVVEAIEAPDLPHCIGVQWHPEKMTDEDSHAALFHALVAAARAHLSTAVAAGH